MRRNGKKGLCLFLTGVVMCLLGIAGMVFFINLIKNHPGQSMPGKELFGAFVLAPAVMIAGIILADSARRQYGFAAGTAPREKVAKRLNAALIAAVILSAALIVLLRSAFSVVIAALLITTAVCARIRSQNTKAFLKACYLAALSATGIVVVLLSVLPAAPGGTVLIVNGFRSYMSNRAGSLIGIVMLLAAGPLLLAWPLALLAAGLYSLCTWELR